MPERTHSKLWPYGNRAFRYVLGLSLMACVTISCDKEDRHKAMTFFFDGVPPLPGEVPEAPFADPNAGRDTGSPSTSGWCVHEPLKTCTNCHTDRRRAGSSPTVQLVDKVPQLCMRCHTEYAHLSGWVHGPVVTGDCLLCHEPHKTKNQFLLKRRVPELCHQCHEPEALALIENHAKESYTQCLDCHDGHSSPSRALLKPEFLNSAAGSKYKVQMYHQRYEQALSKAREGTARGAGVSTMLHRAIGHIENDDLWEARAYIEVLLERQDLSEAERAGLTETLKHLVALTEAGSWDTQPGLSTSLRDLWTQRTERERTTAQLYYRSIEAYHAGRLAEARAGFAEILGSDILLKPMKQTVERYLAEIDRTLGDKQP